MWLNRDALEDRFIFLPNPSAAGRGEDAFEGVGRNDCLSLANSGHAGENPDMDVRGWEDRYRSGERFAEDFEAAPTPLLVETAKKMRPGRALDLACGTGRNALWLAEQGWTVTAVDGSASAIKALRHRATERGLAVDARVADFEKGEYQIERAAWDFITMCYYLQADLFEAAKQGVVPGGIVLAIVHAAEPGEEPTEHTLRSGDLPNHFRGWDILHSYEGKPKDPSHIRRAAEIVARRPTREISS